MSSSIYNLHEGPFGLCSSFWDEKSGQFKSADDVQLLDCCLRTCKPLVDECVEQCPKATPSHQRGLCYETCNDIKESCDNNCQLSYNFWGVNNNPIYKGVKDLGCGDGIYTRLDNKCIVENKDKIIDICEKNCIPEQRLDCTMHCAYSYNMIVNKKDNPLYFNIPANVNAKSPYIKSTRGEQNNSLYFVYALAIVGILFGIWILLKLIK